MGVEAPHSSTDMEFFVDGAISDLTHAGARENETSVELPAGRGAARRSTTPSPSTAVSLHCEEPAST